MKAEVGKLRRRGEGKGRRKENKGRREVGRRKEGR